MHRSRALRLTAQMLVFAILAMVGFAMPAHATDYDLNTLAARAIYFQRYDYETDLLRTIDSMEDLSSADAAMWESVVDFWDAANSSLEINESVPTDLPTSGHAFVVLGYSLAPDGTMQDTMLQRLLVAKAALDAYPTSKVLVAGGAPKNGVTEASVMAAWLIAQGIDSSRIMQEATSSNTAENAVNSTAILYAAGDITSYTLISSASHIRRASVLYEAASLNTQLDNSYATKIVQDSNVAYMDNTTSENAPSAQETSLIASNLATVYGVSTQYSALLASAPTLSALTSLAVTAPTTTSYMIGDSLDATGMVATATYDSGDYTRVVTDDVVLSGYNPTSVGSQTVTVSYTENGTTQTATFDVTVASVISDVSLGVGSNETQRSLAWYSSEDVTQVAQLAPASAVSGTAFPESSATSFDSSESGTSTETTTYYRHATLTGLAANTAYVYRVGSASGWSQTYSFTTQPDDEQTEVIFVGDAQIGSTNTTTDAEGWQETVAAATAAVPDADFMISIGDQVETASSESQYTGFLAPTALESLALATTIGNHDYKSLAYAQHFNRPNVSSSYGTASSSSNSGGDYWFTYGDTLFMVLNTNNTDNASHKAFLEETMTAEGANTTWQVVLMHHSMYSSAIHASDADNVTRRAYFAPVFSELGIDLAMAGHDHCYTRTWLINDGTVSEDTTSGAQSSVQASDGDFLYLTGDSSSGSKYYPLASGTRDYAAVEQQPETPSYTKMTITADSITLKTVLVDDSADVLDTVTLSKAATVTPDTTAPEISLPSDNSVLVGESFDALDGVTASDDTDGELSASVTVEGSVDTSTPGEYTLTYSVSDAAGNTATATRTVTVDYGTWTATPSPTISGTAAVGRTVTAVPGTWSPKATFTYQWALSGAAISGATGQTLTLTPAMAGKSLTVSVSGAASGYQSVTKTSTATVVATSAFVKHPRPTIKGKARKGRTLTVNLGTWSPTPTSFTYQWLANGKSIKKATHKSLKLTSSLIGKRITVKVVAARSGYATRTLVSIRTAKVSKH